MKKANVFEKYQFLLAAVIIGILFVYTNVRNDLKLSANQQSLSAMTANDSILSANKLLSAIADSLQNELNLLNEEMARTTKMSVREQQAAAAVYQIQYYIDITEKRPANRTFFFGWVKRAIKEFIEYDKENKPR